MPITQTELEESIQAAFPDAEIHIKDLAGDNDHWSLTVKDSSFEGLSRIEQHKLVQKAVADKNIHALQIKTLPP